MGPPALFLQGLCLPSVSDWSCESFLSWRCVTLCFLRPTMAPESLPARVELLYAHSKFPESSFTDFVFPSLVSSLPQLNIVYLLSHTVAGKQCSLLSLPATKCAFVVVGTGSACYNVTKPEKEICCADVQRKYNQQPWKSAAFGVRSRRSCLFCVSWVRQKLKQTDLNWLGR